MTEKREESGERWQVRQKKEMGEGEKGESKWRKVEWKQWRKKAKDMC